MVFEWPRIDCSELYIGITEYIIYPRSFLPAERCMNSLFVLYRWYVLDREVELLIGSLPH